jgi:pre-mRNA-splicing factor SYF1
MTHFQVVLVQAIGKLHTLWVAFAKLYERAGDVENARIIFEKATEVAYKYVDDLATVWCEWAEMELRHKHFKRALDLMRRATGAPPVFGRRKVGRVSPTLNL